MISVGRILRSQGKKGELRLKFHRPKLVRISALDKIHIEREGVLREYRVESLFPRGGAYHLKLAGVDTLAQADSLAGAEVLAPEESLGLLDEGEYYIYQLKGCSVLNLEGERIGVVADVVSVPANNLLVVEMEGREILIPFHESICREVDIPGKEIRVDPPDGLLDLDEI
ncbi:MAG: 16S rRNA processing protein RimM [Candidatus Aminicenantes bacterium]|nr:16S rRNA processing protein RimM [Candidatus Aminicenantes bacterium]